MVLHAMDSTIIPCDPFLSTKKEYQEKDMPLSACRIQDELPEDSEQKFGEFVHSLLELVKDNPEKYSNLLVNIPSYDDSSVNENNESFSFGEDRVLKIKDKQFLLKFLRAGNYDCQVATKILVNYILQMRNNPKYYSICRDSERIKSVFKEKIYTMLLHRDKLGRRVFIHRPGKWNPSNVSFTDCYCVVYMLSEMIALEERTQISGCLGIVDGTNIGLKQLSSMGLDDIKCCAQFIQVHNYFKILWQ